MGLLTSFVCYLFRLLVKVLEKLSRSGFHFVGMKLTEGDQSDKV